MFFFFTNLSQSYFFIAGGFLYRLKILILLAILLIFLIKIFVSLVKLLNLSLAEYNFLSHVK